MVSGLMVAVGLVVEGRVTLRRAISGIPALSSTGQRALAYALGIEPLADLTVLEGRYAPLSGRLLTDRLLNDRPIQPASRRLQ